MNESLYTGNIDDASISEPFAEKSPVLYFGGGDMATKMEQSILVKKLGGSPKIKIIDFLLDNFNLDFSKKEIAIGADISVVTLNKVWNEMIKDNIITPTRKFGKAQLYKLNIGNNLVKNLIQMEKQLIEDENTEQREIVLKKKDHSEILEA